MKTYAPLQLALAVLLALVLAPSLARSEDASGDPQAGEQTTGPQFRDEKYEESWKAGKAAFEKGDLKTAKKELMNARRGVADTESRTLVEHWVTAIKYVPGLERMKQYMEKKQYSLAYEMYGTLYPRLYGTPAQTEMFSLSGQLDQLLFQTIEDFDYRKPDYTEKYGKFFISDKRLVLRGPGCLRWQNTKDRKPGMLKVKRVPRNWKDYAAVEFWVRVLSKQQIPVEAVIVCDMENTKGTTPPRAAPKGQALISGYHYPTKLNPGGQWTRILLKIKDFKPNIAPDLGAVQDFRLQIPRGRTFDFLIDEIRVMRKDPEPPASARGRRR